ncbi:MAG: hypothetical protein J6Z44_04715 [Bacteroidales bacterium]|nr:hypothetical protein [Bacteroidales bacterium]
MVSLLALKYLMPVLAPVAIPDAVPDANKWLITTNANTLMVIAMSL